MILKEPKLTFAYNRLGELIHISSAEKGLECGCKCPQCGEPLVAKKGARVRHHFAHKADSDCTEAQAFAAYRLIMKVLSERKSIMLPTYKSILYRHKSELATVEQVIEEQRVGKRLGFGLQTDKGEIQVILVYRKSIGESQKESIRQKADRCIAIDMVPVVNEDMTEDNLAAYLLKEQGKTWMSHKEYDQLAGHAQQDLRKANEVRHAHDTLAIRTDASEGYHVYTTVLIGSLEELIGAFRRRDTKAIFIMDSGAPRLQYCLQYHPAEEGDADPQSYFWIRIGGQYECFDVADFPEWCPSLQLAFESGTAVYAVDLSLSMQRAFDSGTAVYAVNVVPSLADSSSELQC